MTALAQKSSSIGEIIDSISQIAKQTNLLALNAAIDAMLKDIISTIGETNKAIDRNTVIVSESNEKLDGTVKIFDAMLKSSEQVTGVETILESMARVQAGIDRLAEVLSQE